ncbi:MAG TPA: DUF1573 domain-containing protein [Flavisolibacter sp.]|nr:DUF1573 domain-containing protein [Flavisolibacter sp.]
MFSVHLMKKAVVLLALHACCLTAARAQAPSETIRFDERVFNFGTIQEKKGKVSHTFVFRNTGKTPVVINDIYSACGCIGKAHSNEAVKPGGTGKVTVTFDPGYREGFFSKEIVVYSNNGKSYNRIWVEGSIVPAERPIEDDYPYSFGSGLYLRLKVMAFGYVKPGETKQMQLHYANATDKEMTLAFEVQGGKHGLQFTNPGKLKPKQKGIVTFTYTMPATSRSDAILVVLPIVNNKKLNEKLEIKVLNELKL